MCWLGFLATKVCITSLERDEDIRFNSKEGLGVVDGIQSSAPSPWVSLPIAALQLTDHEVVHLAISDFPYRAVGSLLGVSSSLHK